MHEGEKFRTKDTTMKNSTKTGIRVKTAIKAGGLAISNHNVALITR